MQAISAMVNVPVLGKPTDVWTAALAVGAETIAIADPATLSAGAVKELAWHLEDHGIEVMVVPAITDVAGPRITVRLAAGLPLLYLDEPHLSLGGRFLKSAFDRFVGFVALVILSPILLLIGLVVRVSSSGPALFKQVRVGEGGRKFRMWKFRTMVADAEDLLPDLSELNQHDGLLFKIPDDPRITGLGRFLRRWSIDELPQLWNVVRGQMSIVGPRPPLPSEVERYDTQRATPPPGEAGTHGSVAGQRSLEPLVGGGHPARPALHRELVAGHRPRHHRQDREGGRIASGSVLAVAMPSGHVRSTTSIGTGGEPFGEPTHQCGVGTPGEAWRGRRWRRGATCSLEPVASGGREAG